MYYKKLNIVLWDRNYRNRPHSQKASENDFHGPLGQALPLSSRVSLARPVLSWAITSKRLLRRLVFALKLEKLLENDKITALHCVKQIRFPSIISNITNHTNEIWKTLWIISFQKAQLPSISIFCNTVHSKFLSFVFALLFIRYFHVLRRNFCFT